MPYTDKLASQVGIIEGDEAKDDPCIPKQELDERMLEKRIDKEDDSDVPYDWYVEPEPTY